ncbi:HoxN/HupN/NixA family nickel/cobalt transporter [Taibaiella soli]|uniref:Nickel/cobalt efflux system n=1 Tax=Taibaiella soli TaxID=1649169 RepID=A0A2W2AGQ3_9BACT|nr:nickel permease [Taibaiella soli]PZF72702.1 nickel permease [Taibaiella soli]
MELSGILLMFLLGLRHGFDPDHIAIIDNISVRYSSIKPRLAKWTGTLFATGHGSVVTCIAVMISKVSHSWHFSAATWNILDWIPGLILIGVGMINLRMLLRSKTYRPKGFKMLFLPARLKNSSSPMAIVFTGILFAMVFDTNTQAAAWAYTATSTLTTSYALLLGTAFSTGMIITDTIDSRILFKLMKHAADNQSVRSYRRKIGWIIVSISLLVGGYKLAVHLIPAMELDENVLTLLGVSFFAIMILFYSYILYTGLSANKKEPWQSKI